MVGYLNNLRAGDVLLFIIVMCWAAGWIIEKVGKLRTRERDIAAKDITEKNQYTNLVNDVASTQEELGELKESTKTLLDVMKRSIESYVETSTGSNEHLIKTIAEIEELTNDHEQRIVVLEKSVERMIDQIDLLFKSDKEYFKAYIVEGYNKYVKGEQEISLITLQNLESMYNKYLNENPDGADEFLARIMRELRNLPTTHND